MEREEREGMLHGWGVESRIILDKDPISSKNLSGPMRRQNAVERARYTKGEIHNLVYFHSLMRDAKN
jgi:hypothetical protein